MRSLVILFVMLFSVDARAMEHLQLNLRSLGREVGDAQHDVRLSGSGRVGGTVAHVWEVPGAYVMGGGGGALRYKLTFHRRIYFSVELGGSAGIGDGGEPFGSYRVTATGGWKYLVTRFLTLSAEVQGGLGSYSLIPLPRATFGHNVTLTPLSFEHFWWDVEWQLNGGALAVMPTASTSLSTSLNVQLWKIYAGVEAGVSGEVLIAAVANSASGSANLRGYVGVRL